MTKNTHTLMVLSHLRWDFVTQRPQHLMHRLAKTYNVIFIEEPIFTERKTSTIKIIKKANHIQVVQISAPSLTHFDYINQVKRIATNVSSQTLPLLWLYSPAYIHFVKQIPHKLLIFDCMDELAAFKGASAVIKNQERLLLQKADLVFTGGYSLYKSKSKFNAATYCFPSSVDLDHFTQAQRKTQSVPTDIKDVTHPIVGFYGVLDERLDLQLISNTAKLLPDVSFVMIGPVVKIDPDSLPQAPNLHYLGMKTYEELPLYLQEFDICWMPFALNEATKFISPTKTLEFMAALKPIISTPIQDVARIYQDIVTITTSPQEIKHAITHYLNESGRLTKARHKKQQEILAKSSWDKTATAMNQLIQQSLRHKYDHRDESSRLFAISSGGQV